LSDDSLIRNISDTARWVAIYRALETERPDALFRDPFARELAGPRGQQIFDQMPESDRTWPFTMRTVLFDRAILRAVAQGFDMVVNLAAGLDARPYRMALPPKLKWVEVDLPAILEEKEKTLRAASAACVVERVALDLADIAERRALFERLGNEGQKILAITEGLLIYLERESVRGLTDDLAAVASFQRWTLDLASPGLLRLLQKNVGGPLDKARTPLRFAPPEGPAFFEPSGWKAIEVHSLFKAAAKAKRIPLFLRLMAALPESSGRQGGRPWGAVCVFDRVRSVR
jgi:methyltransferase (TIGR00027 family)